MTPDEPAFRETTAERRVASVPLSHLSIELGHLYMEDLAAGVNLPEYFQRIAPWARAGHQACAEGLTQSKSRARISTCVLIDDYFTPFSSPAELVPALTGAAREAGLEIDYLVRESGCADADEVSLAGDVHGRLVDDPSPNTNGSRPPPTKAGWLCNGQRSPVNDAVGAMTTTRPWAPPVQNGARRHSIFLDVELWDKTNGRQTWSCPFLAAVWQLLRLGMLRHHSEAVVPARKWDGALPDQWNKLHVVTQLNPTAAPFSAYRTLSILSTRFLPIEHAVRTILSQVAVDREVLSQVITRSQAEGIDLPPELVDRIEYVFVGNGAGHPQ